SRCLFRLLALFVLFSVLLFGQPTSRQKEESMFHYLTRRAAPWAKPVGRCRPLRRSPPLKLEELEPRDQPSSMSLIADAVRAGPARTVTAKAGATNAAVSPLHPSAAAFRGGAHPGVGKGLIVRPPGGGGGPDVKVLTTPANCCSASCLMTPPSGAA